MRTSTGRSKFAGSTGVSVEDEPSGESVTAGDCSTAGSKFKDITPEIAEIHHDRLPYWALFKAYSVPDRETYDPNRAKKALDEFEAYFGERWQPGRQADNERQSRYNRKW